MRRPLAADEVPFLTAMGQEVRRLRRCAGLSRFELGLGAVLTEAQVGYIERGASRTREHATPTGVGDGRRCAEVG
jgi:hypothetical protein